MTTRDKHIEPVDNEVLNFANPVCDRGIARCYKIVCRKSKIYIDKIVVLQDSETRLTQRSSL